MGGPTYWLYRQLGSAIRFLGVMGVTNESAVVSESVASTIKPEASSSAIKPETVLSSLNPEE